MKLILLDSNSLINRAFYALPMLQDKTGRYTGAIYAFSSMLSKLIKSEKPTHIVAAFDVHAPTFRHLKYDAYKAKRRPMPEELRAQVPAMKELLIEMGIAVVEKAGFEADDIIGTLAAHSPMPTVIVSGDKDVLQLVSENVTVLHTRKGISDVIRYTPETLAEEGLSPQGVIELKSLMGDTSDNIPGVPGVGEKTAKELIGTYGSLSGVYEHIGEIKGKLQEKLLTGRESAEFSRWLATICTEAPIEYKDYSGYTFNPLLPYKVKTMMIGYDFKSLTDRFSFAEPVEEKADAMAKNVEITALSELKIALSEAKSHREMVLLFGENMISFAFDDETNYTVRYSFDLFGETLSYDTIIEEITPYLYRKDLVKYTFGLKRVYALLGLDVSDIFDGQDLLLMAYIADCGKTYEDVASLLAAHGYSDEAPAASLFTLKNSLRNKMIQSNSLKVYETIELPLVKVLYDMEKSGFRVDNATLSRLSEKYSSEVKSLTEEIYRSVGHEFNMNSPKQLAEVLFDELGLPTGKKRSTNADVLAELEDAHPVVSLILRYRQISKLLSTYLIAMKSMIDTFGYIHTVFNQANTTTGRLSSSEPNLQNIPVRDEEGKEIRGAFIPSDGNLLVSADYSQIELRLMAHFSADPSLIEAFQRGVDIHASTAAKVFGVEESAVTSKMRRDAKAVNFGIIYGISDFGLSKNIGCSVREARDFIEKYLDTYPKIRDFMKSSVSYAKEHGYVVTAMGRIRALPEISSSNYAVRSFGERAALNMPLQGTAADIIKLAMIRVYDRLKKQDMKAKIILQVHDELILDVPRGELEEIKRIVKEEMEHVVDLKVPLTVNVESGATWKDAK